MFLGVDSIAKNTFYMQTAVLVIANLLSRFLGFLYRLPMTRYIGDEGNGIYAAGYYIYMLFLTISSAGLPVAISRMVSEKIVQKQYRAAHEIFKTSLLFAVCVGSASSLILCFGARFLCDISGHPASYYSVLTLSPTVFLVAVVSAYRGYFQGMGNNVPTAFSQIAEQIFNATFSVLLAYLLIPKGVEYGSAGGTAGTGIGAFIGLMVIMGIYQLASPRFKKRIRNDEISPKSVSRKKIIRELVSISIPIIIGTAIFSITNLIDMGMVKSRLLFAGFSDRDAEVLYGMLTGKYVVLTTLPVSISTAISITSVPNIAASMLAKNKADVNKKINRSLRLTMLVSMPASAGIGILGRQILRLLFPSYSEGGILLEVGSISIIFLALSQIATGLLQGTGKEKVPAFAALCGALVKIPLNYFLIAIPGINVIGAVISTIGCYVTASMISMYVLIKTTKIKMDYMGTFVKPLVASVLMGAVSYVSYYVIYFIIPSNSIAVLIAVLISIATYFAIMIFMKGLNQEDLSAIPYGGRLVKVLKRYKLI